MTKPKLVPLDLSFGSELPTQPDMERAAFAAYLTAKALAARQAAARAHKEEEPPWCDSEAPTGVELERPVFPGPPRKPQL